MGYIDNNDLIWMVDADDQPPLYLPSMNKVFLFLVTLLLAAKVNAQVADSSKRQLVLTGATNFRDLGGYKTADGHQVKWAQLYRSADISKLTETDLDLLKKRHIASVVDLRGHQEQAQAPDRINSGTDYILTPAGSDNLGSWMKGITKLKGKAGDSLMVVYYTNIDSMAARYIPFFKMLIDLPADKSLVFHCSAGKDRTGIAAALLLTALGVPEKTIMDDYLASNVYRASTNPAAVKGMVAVMHIDAKVAEDMMLVKPAYLNATLHAIRKQYGSVDNYLKTQIGLGDVQIARLKARFLD